MRSAAAASRKIDTMDLHHRSLAAFGPAVSGASDLDGGCQTKLLPGHVASRCVAQEHCRFRSIAASVHASHQPSHHELRPPHRRRPMPTARQNTPCTSSAVSHRIQPRNPAAMAVQAPCWEREGEPGERPATAVLEPRSASPAGPQAAARQEGHREDGCGNAMDGLPCRQETTQGQSTILGQMW